MKKSFFQVMNHIKTKRKKAAILIGLVFCLSIYSLIRYATATEPTNIKSEYKFAWGENTGWFNFGSNDGGVMVTDQALSGYVWSENLGWISLNCSNDNSCAASDYKVANDGEGNLSGYAWGENIGWVNFSPTDGGVHIDSNSAFSGYAWNENTGWIVFNCQDLDVCSDSEFKVKTTWIPVSVRNRNNNQNESEGVDIRDVHYSSTDTTIVINWDTNHDADSHIRWGSDKNLEKEKNDNDNEKKHRMILRNLEPDTGYYFRIKSTDENDNSDSSKIYSISTKPTSAIFSKRQWEKTSNEESGNDYEKVNIDVTDKNESVQKEEENKDNKDNKISEIKVPEQKPSVFANFFSAMKNGISDFFSAVHDLALYTQRKIVAFFSATGDQIAGIYDSVVSRFSKEKATQIAKLNQAKFFTTEVFSRNETKMLAEVKFQILDKADNPITGMETTLFSDPKTSVTDDNGIAAFQDVPIGSHTLAFDYQGENFQKKVAIADTLTDEGKVRAEIVQVKAEKERIAAWMWAVIGLLVVTIGIAIYFARKYYKLLKQSDDRNNNRRTE